MQMTALAVLLMKVPSPKFLGVDAGRPCSPEQKEPHWKEVDGQCLPSCGAAKGAYCKTKPARASNWQVVKKQEGNSLVIRRRPMITSPMLPDRRKRKKKGGRDL